MSLFARPSEPEFQGFRKIPRWSRPATITEKIDGTNGVVYVSEDLETVKAGSKSHWLGPAKRDDNLGFGLWVAEHESDLKSLGPGYHYGEWWGRGINRGYGVPDKRFSLFNTSRWNGPGLEAKPDWQGKIWRQPTCCLTVPVIMDGLHMDDIESGIIEAMTILREKGSLAAPGFTRPEGIVIFHTAGNALFKKTLENDDAPKGRAEE